MFQRIWIFGGLYIFGAKLIILLEWEVRYLTGFDPWSCLGGQFKKVMAEKLAVLPEQDSWTLPYLGKLLEQGGELYYQMEDTSELTELIESLCIN